MKMITWPPHILLLLLMALLLAACGGAAPEPVVEEVPEQPAADAGQEEAAEEQAAAEEEAPVQEESPAEEEEDAEEPAETEPVSSVSLTLLSRQAMTEHSEAPADMTAAPATIEPPPEDSWRELQPNESTEFESYDGVRVREEGEAWLDLGDLMHLILKRDSVAQFVPGEDARDNLANLEVEIDAPLLQRLVLGLHLSRGGLTGDKLEEENTVALTTPNAVIIVSGTQFFLAYDPEENTTIAGNFNGTVDVVAPELQEEDELRQREMIAIPPVRGEKFWPIHPHLDFDEFQRLIDVLESPIAAVDMISGPYLVIETVPGIDVRGGPGPTFPPVGTMDAGDYARIIAEGNDWWQIECPEDLGGSECWVAAGDSAAYNEEYAEEAPTATPTFTPTVTPIPVAICRVSESSVGLWSGPGGQRGDGGLIYNRIGYEVQDAELIVLGQAYSGQWYQVESLDSGSEGWVYAPNCPLINEGPIPAITDYLPTVTYTPSPTPTPTPTNTPTPTPTYTPTPTPTYGTIAPPYADFSYYEDGFTVYFTNLSYNADSYLWDFGDGNTSTAENPTHTYVVESEGSYAFTVSLTAYGPGGSDTLIEDDLITGWYIK